MIYILFEPSGQGVHADIDMASIPVSLSHAVAKFGLIIDSELTMGAQVNSLIRSSFFPLRRIAKLKFILTIKQWETVHAFISSRLYYSSTLVGIKASLSRLQLVQNGAARLLSHVERRQHIIPFLMSMHCLPVHFSIRIKILLFVCKSEYNCPRIFGRTSLPLPALLCS